MASSTWGSLVEDTRSIVMGRADRRSSPAKLAPRANERVPESWTRDGALLAFSEIHPGSGQDIWLLDAASGQTRAFANTGFKENQARFSRDGKWLAYVSDESGRDEVYLQSVDAGGVRVQVSIDGGHSPLWSPDGKELFYVERVALMQVNVNLAEAWPDVPGHESCSKGATCWSESAISIFCRTDNVSCLSGAAT